LYRAKLVRGAAVAKFVLPSFEGAVPPRGQRTDERKARPQEHDPAKAERDGYTRGFEAGEKAGADSAAKEARRLLDGLRAAAGALNALRAQMVQEAEPQVAELALAVARRIVMEELEDRPERVVRIVREAIRRIERGGPVTVRVHPDLYSLVRGLREDGADMQAEIVLDVDPSVPPAGPIVSGTTEEVLTDVDEQIRVIAEDLRTERAAR
jgi:flagellar biosynthesis/type III secretory pathway protein FliH